MSELKIQRPGSAVRCGTASGYRSHQKNGEKPCDACAAAKSAYDKRRREAPPLARRSRAHAKAQSRALRRLKDSHPDEYRALYEQAKAEVAAEDLEDA